MGKVSLILILGLSFFAHLVFAKVEVRVAELSTVRLGEVVRLGQISHGLEKNMEVAVRLYNTVVIDAVQTEGVQKISSSQIAMALRAKLSVQDLNQISLKLPETISLNVQRNFVPTNDLKLQILTQAWETCKPCDPVIEDLKFPNLTSKEEILAFRLETSQLQRAGGFLLPLTFETSKGRTQHWVSGRLSIEKEAPVAKRLIGIGERITESDYELKKISFGFSRDGIPTVAELNGKIAARPLMLGQVIYQANVKKESAIERGQILRVVTGTEEFEIHSSGVAEQSGAIGDLIKFKMTETNKMMSGVLVEKGVVRVE